MANLNINGKTFNVDVEPDTPLLWAIRENVGLTGTKYGCGIAQCGACTVHIDGVATRSCGVAVSDAEGKKITTIEGLAERRHAAQGAAGLDRQRRPAMRLLPERHDHGGGGASEGEAEADRRRHRRGHHQYLPLRHLPAGARGDPRRSRTPEEAAHEQARLASRSTAAPSSSAPPLSAPASRSASTFPSAAPPWSAPPTARRKSMPGS